VARSIAALPCDYLDSNLSAGQRLWFVLHLLMCGYCRACIRHLKLTITMILGFLFILWYAPEMSVTRFALVLLLSICIFEGIRHEEGGLIEEFGDGCQAYRKEIGLFFTWR